MDAAKLQADSAQQQGKQTSVNLAAILVDQLEIIWSVAGIVCRVIQVSNMLDVFVQESPVCTALWAISASYQGVEFRCQDPRSDAAPSQGVVWNQRGRSLWYDHSHDIILSIGEFAHGEAHVSICVAYGSMPALSWAVGSCMRTNIICLWVS